MDLATMPAPRFLRRTFNLATPSVRLLKLSLPHRARTGSEVERPRNRLNPAGAFGFFRGEIVRILLAIGQKVCKNFAFPCTNAIEYAQVYITIIKWRPKNLQKFLPLDLKKGCRPCR